MAAIDWQIRRSLFQVVNKFTWPETEKSATLKHTLRSDQQGPFSVHSGIQRMHKLLLAGSPSMLLDRTASWHVQQMSRTHGRCLQTWQMRQCLVEMYLSVWVLMPLQSTALKSLRHGNIPNRYPLRSTNIKGDDGMCGCSPAWEIDS